MTAAFENGIELPAAVVSLQTTFAIKNNWLAESDQLATGGVCVMQSKLV